MINKINELYYYKQIVENKFICLLDRLNDVIQDTHKDIEYFFYLYVIDNTLQDVNHQPVGTFTLYDEYIEETNEIGLAGYDLLSKFFIHRNFFTGEQLSDEKLDFVVLSYFHPEKGVTFLLKESGSSKFVTVELQEYQEKIVDLIYKKSSYFKEQVVLAKR